MPQDSIITHWYKNLWTLVLGSGNLPGRRFPRCYRNQPTCQRHHSHWWNLELSGTHICVNLASQPLYFHLLILTRNGKTNIQRRHLTDRKDRWSRSSWRADSTLPEDKLQPEETGTSGHFTKPLFDLAANVKS
jgi:hypothetical protein